MKRSAWVAVVLFAIVAGLAWQRTQPGDRASISLLVTGGTVVTMDAAGTVVPDGAVAIDGTTIVAIGTAADLDARYQARERIDARGQVIMPGLINTHTHAPMVLFRGLADDLALMDWLTQYIFPAEKATVSPEFVRVGTRLALLEMIESGTTTYADMYYFEEEIAAVTKAAGVRGVLGQTIIRFPVADAATPEEGLARSETFLTQWANDPLIVPAVAPHAPYTLTPETLKAARALADKYRAPLLIHLAETRDEVGIIAGQFKLSPAMFLDSLGFWGGRSLAAHAVWVDEADMKMLAARGVGLSHNPESNMKLASGTAPVTGWLSAGIPAGLGTDGAASNNDLDMFEAVRTAALLHKHATGDPRAMPARQALELATRRGAAALGLGDRIGSLETGKLADVITVSMSSARQTPLFDPLSHLVYVTRGTDVRNTIVHGRVLMRQGRVISLNRSAVLQEATAMAEKVRAAVSRKEGQ
ncbi:MAG: amidohydrolase [Acidobacteria bacterium]|jgi:5-methylthioadenosine/S-adenosylhomocysteine deaminase|nr:amidohydrolase [Acidobacteriota bacterium]